MKETNEEFLSRISTEYVDLLFAFEGTRGFKRLTRLGFYKHKLNRGIGISDWKMNEVHTYTRNHWSLRKTALIGKMGRGGGTYISSDPNEIAACKARKEKFNVTVFKNDKLAVLDPEFNIGGGNARADKKRNKDFEKAIESVQKLFA